MSKKSRSHRQTGVGAHAHQTQLDMQRYLQQLVGFTAQSADKRFQQESLAHRVEVKANPQREGEFVMLAILKNGDQHEGRLRPGMREIDWCLAPNCICMGYAATKSPFEAGATIDDTTEAEEAEPLTMQETLGVLDRPNAMMVAWTLNQLGAASRDELLAHVPPTLNLEEELGVLHSQEFVEYVGNKVILTLYGKKLAALVNPHFHNS